MDFKGTMAGLKEQWRMFRELWKTVPADCRGSLVGELVLNPKALQRRYDEEMSFKQRLDGRWQ